MQTFLDAETLVERVVSAVGGHRPVVFLIASGATMPQRLGDPGVPSTGAIVEHIRERFPKLSLPEGTSFQEAFSALSEKRGPDESNKVIRRAVLKALRVESDDPDNLSPEKLELDWRAWHVPDGLSALAAHHPSTFSRSALTTNFDPLIEVSLTRAGAPWHSMALHGDGSLLYLRGTGMSIVHLHGHWWGSDTLHTPKQLSQSRHQLRASLKRILNGSVVVVAGYSGWRDVFSARRSNRSRRHFD